MKKDEFSPFVATFLFTVAALYLFNYVMDTLGDRKFSTALSPLVADGLTFEATQGKGFPWLLAGFVIKVVALVITLVAAYLLLKNIHNGALYNRSSARHAQTMAFSLLGWLVGGFVENMGNNMAASRLGLDEQWGKVATLSSIHVIVWIFIVMLYLLERSITQAMRMKEDIDDLV